MANQEHLELLAQGPKAWNAWRLQHPDVRPDLRGASRKNANLSGADLSGTDLTDANLNYTELFHANLNAATLMRANLTGANLEYAILLGANLTRANLTRANLNYTDLPEANLREANLTGANLTGAFTGHTLFRNVDLSTVRGLDAVKHVGPSTIGIDTIYRSHGKIADLFLRGCGVPDTFITYMRSLTETAFDFYSCFISYSTKDQTFADRLYADLQAKGVRCWLASEDLKIGERFRSRIDQSIRIHDKLLLVLSEHSIRSPWVESEVEAAFEREHREKKTVLFPIRLDDAVMDTNEAWAADIRRTRHIGDFTGWDQHAKHLKALERLMRDLKAPPDDKAAAKPAP
jgi:uncharacterized protein YjbI with pentapeptide repeats